MVCLVVKVFLPCLFISSPLNWMKSEDYFCRPFQIKKSKKLSKKVLLTRFLWKVEYFLTSLYVIVAHHSSSSWPHFQHASHHNSVWMKVWVLCSLFSLSTLTPHQLPKKILRDAAGLGPCGLSSRRFTGWHERGVLLSPRV